MTPTITQEIGKYLVNTAIGFNMVTFLINMPSLGLTDTPTDSQLLSRIQLTMATAVAQECTDATYSRFIVTFSPSAVIYTQSTNLITIPITSTFSGTISSFTHVCYGRGANLTGASSGNGNNRGDTTGTLYKVEPVVGAPLSLASGATFTHTGDISFVL